MTTEVHTSSEPSTTGLLRGIINDIGDLIRQELQFARMEFRADLRRTREAALVLSLGLVTTGLGLILLSLMLVHLLHWLSAPAGTDPSALPLWGCYALVSVVFLAAGAGLSWWGYQKFERFNPLPDETAQTVKENVEWIMNSK